MGQSTKFTAHLFVAIFSLIVVVIVQMVVAAHGSDAVPFCEFLRFVVVYTVVKKYLELSQTVQ